MKLREKLSDLEHKQWQHWTNYFLRHHHYSNFRKRWKNQCSIPYSNLSEKEKDSDRIYADKVIKIVSNKLRYVLSRHSVMRGSTKRTPKEIINEVFS